MPDGGLKTLSAVCHRQVTVDRAVSRGYDKRGQEGGGEKKIPVVQNGASEEPERKMAERNGWLVAQLTGGGIRSGTQCL